MQDEERERLNKFIHETVLGKNEHPLGYHPDYSRSLDLTALAEAKVIAVKGSNRYWHEINLAVKDYPEGMVSLLTATAEQRCLAIEAAWTSSVIFNKSLWCSEFNHKRKI